MAILQHTAQEIAVLASSDITRPRDLDGATYAGFGYPNEEPTLRSVIEADGGTGDLHDGDPRHGGVRGALREACGLRRSRSAAWEGIEAEEAGHRSPNVRLQRTTAFRTSTRSSSPATADWLAARAGTGARLRRRDGRAASSSRRPTRMPPRSSWSRRTRASSTATRRCPLAVSAFLADGGYLLDDERRGGPTDAEPVAGLLGLPVRAGPARRTRTVSRSRSPPDYEALFTNDYLP